MLLRDSSCVNLVSLSRTAIRQGWQARSMSGVMWPLPDKQAKLALQLMFYLNLLFQNTWSTLNDDYTYFDIPELITSMYSLLSCKNLESLSLFMSNL